MFQGLPTLQGYSPLLDFDRIFVKLRYLYQIPTLLEQEIKTISGKDYPNHPQPYRSGYLLIPNPHLKN